METDDERAKVRGRWEGSYALVGRKDATEGCREGGGRDTRRRKGGYWTETCWVCLPALPLPPTVWPRAGRSTSLGLSFLPYKVKDK